MQLIEYTEGFIKFKLMIFENHSRHFCMFIWQKVKYDNNNFPKEL